MALAADHSRAVVLLLSIHCLLSVPLFCGVFVYGPCFVVHLVLTVVSRFEIISMRRRELVAF